MDLIRNNNSGKTHALFQGQVLCRRIKDLKGKLDESDPDRDIQIEYLLRNVPISRVIQSVDCEYCKNVINPGKEEH